MSTPFKAYSINDKIPYNPREHNTMRFDVSFAYLQPMLWDDPELKDRLAREIEEAIIKTANKLLKWRPSVSLPVESEFLHHHSINYDLS